ncbi:hypothetical protein VTN00DRAFT_369 [Thermoascus crustaceus]|uniref:uncharacterized protein n=1 Tax=Thermoascus crustaceus TaxID=5088 RepID=UPI0037425B75
MTDQNAPTAAAPAAEPEPDGARSDSDSAFASTNGSDLTSLSSSIKAYVYENGRRYHSYREGEYVLPNDEQEQDRLDLSHHIYKMLLGGELYLSPIGKNPQRVLDIGTGTGIWAIDFADLHPGAEVLGNDLSPIQPRWVPPNCRFEVDDFEAEWTYSRNFDFIHGREIEGSVRDYDRLFERCFEHLRPGGYLEMQSMGVVTYSDDGSDERATNFHQVVDLIQEASGKFGKSMKTMGTWKGKMEKAGFTNVKQKVFKVPQSPWHDDPKMKEIGLYNQANLLEALSSYTYALLSRVLQWRRVEIEVLLAGARREIKDLSIHLTTDVYIVYGQKPEEAAKAHSLLFPPSSRSLVLPFLFLYPTIFPSLLTPTHVYTCLTVESGCAFCRLMQQFVKQSLSVSTRPPIHSHFTKQDRRRKFGNDMKRKRDRHNVTNMSSRIIRTAQCKCRCKEEKKTRPTDINNMT